VFGGSHCSDYFSILLPSCNSAAGRDGRDMVYGKTAVSAAAERGKSMVDIIPAAQLGSTYQGLFVLNVSLIPPMSVFTPEYASP